MFCEVAYVEREIGQVPLDAHQEEIVVEVQVLVRMQNISVVAIDKIVDGSVQTLLVGTTEQQDGAMLQVRGSL
jgi:hypothetical protein